jgi:hypothetical protein
MSIDPRAVFTFDSSHHAFWAEDLARERGLSIDVIPAPAHAESKCGLALRLPLVSATDLEALCQQEGIRFRRWEES